MARAKDSLADISPHILDDRLVAIKRQCGSGISLIGQPRRVLEGFPLLKNCTKR